VLIASMIFCDSELGCADKHPKRVSRETRHTAALMMMMNIKKAMKKFQFQTFF
jgi:hypothetical protein